MITPPKRCEVDKVLHLLVLKKTKKEIREKLGLKPSALANHLRRLEDLGYIERRGKYIINILRSSHLNPRVTRNQVHNKLNKRGHGFNIKILFPMEKDLRRKKNVVNEFKKGKLEKLPFKSLKFTKDKNTIWINKESLTIYSNNSYYSKDALLSKFRALKEIDNLVKDLKQRFEFTGVYGIEVFREHYGLIFNKFAEWLNKKGRKMYIKNEKNKSILWVDKSRKDDIGLDELEGSDPLKVNAMDRFFESQEVTEWKVTPGMVLESMAKRDKAIQKNAENLDYHAENMRSHVGATRELKTATKQLRLEFKDGIRELVGVIKELKKQNGK